MSIKINHELPVPEVLKNEYPLSNEQKSIKQQRDEEKHKISIKDNELQRFIRRCIFRRIPVQHFR